MNRIGSRSAARAIHVRLRPRTVGLVGAQQPDWEVRWLRRRRRGRSRYYAVPLLGGYCSGCGAPIVGTTSKMKPCVGGRFCSRACMLKAVTTRTSDRPCQQCGKGFRPNQRTVNAGRFCSRQCAFAYLKRRGDYGGAPIRPRRDGRSARLKGVRKERFQPRDIFVRDRWTCQICGVATPEALRGLSDAGAPTIDHVIPLSAGGEHTTGNVRCACLRCNLRKGGRVEEKVVGKS